MNNGVTPVSRTRIEQRRNDDQLDQLIGCYKKGDKKGDKKPLKNYVRILYKESRLSPQIMDKILKSGIEDDYFVFFKLIINKDLKPEDRKLFFDYFRAKEQGNAQICADLRRKAQQIFLQLDQQRFGSVSSQTHLKRFGSVSSQTHLNSQAEKRLEAFVKLMEYIKAAEGQEFTNNVLQMAFKYLANDDRVLLGDYSKEKIPSKKADIKQNIMRKILAYYSQINQLPFGIPQRKYAIRNFMALYSAAQGVGISSADIENSLFRLGTDLSDKDIAVLQKAGQVLGTAKLSDDESMKKQIMFELAKYYLSFLKFLGAGKVDTRELAKYRESLSNYASYAKELGAPQAEIEAMMKKIESQVPPIKYNAVSLEEILKSRQQNVGFVVNLDNLDPKLLDSLKKIELKPGYSYYDFVKDSGVKYIILEKDILGKRFGEGSSPLGVTTGLFPVIEVDVLGSKDREINLSDIFATIVHESFHVWWAKKHFNDSELMSKTVNEGIAFWLDHQAQKDFLNYYRGSLSASEILHIQDSIVQSQQAVIGAFNLLGIKENDMPKDFSDLDSFIERLKGLRTQKDFDVYPTQTPEPFVNQFTNMFIASGYYYPQNAEAQKAFEDALKSILTGKTTLIKTTPEVQEMVKTILTRFMPELKGLEYPEMIRAYRNYFVLQTGLTDVLKYQIDENLSTIEKLLTNPKITLSKSEREAIIKRKAEIIKLKKSLAENEFLHSPQKLKEIIRYFSKFNTYLQAISAYGPQIKQTKEFKVWYENASKIVDDWVGSLDNKIYSSGGRHISGEFDNEILQRILSMGSFTGKLKSEQYARFYGVSLQELLLYQQIKRKVLWAFEEKNKDKIKKIEGLSSEAKELIRQIKETRDSEEKKLLIRKLGEIKKQFDALQKELEDRMREGWLEYLKSDPKMQAVYQKIIEGDRSLEEYALAQQLCLKKVSEECEQKGIKDRKEIEKVFIQKWKEMLDKNPKLYLIHMRLIKSGKIRS